MKALLLIALPVLGCGDDGGGGPAQAEAVAEAADGSGARPNILLILADDLGYADLGVQGSREAVTPNIDALAAGGVRCTNGYISGPVCSPSRAGLMTGRYQQRFGHEFNGRSLPLTEITLADRLKAAGYATGLVGKWHLGLEDPHHPMRRGFDEFFGFVGGGHSYLRWSDKILRGTQVAPREATDLTTAFTREAASFIERHRAHPFFLYLSYNAVHTPLEARPEYLARFAHVADPERRTYLAMLSALDDGIGAVMGKLREGGLEENTLVFFLSDNGGATYANASTNDPLKKWKGTLYEGGIRTPFFVQWKGRLPAGTFYEKPVISLDVYATALAAAGGRPPEDRPIDGVNLLPHLRGRRTEAPHEFMYWRYGDPRAIRKGAWKLHKGRPDAPGALFDLSVDVGETTNRAAERPDLVAELDAALAAWNAQMK